VENGKQSVGGRNSGFMAMTKDSRRQMLHPHCSSSSTTSSSNTPSTRAPLSSTENLQWYSGSFSRQVVNHAAMFCM